jgi:hypothetical protein
VRLDPSGKSDDRKLTVFGCFGPSIKVSDGINDRLVEGSTGVVAWGVDHSGLASSPRWQCAVIPEH